MGQNDDLLDKLRYAKQRRHLTYQDIVDRTEKNGEAVSMTTVRRVFAEDARLENFRYRQTVAPITHVLLDEEPEEWGSGSQEIEKTRGEIYELLDDYLGNMIQRQDEAYRWFRIAICAVGALVVLCTALILTVGPIRY